jgi:hypothetical protein
MRYLLITYYQKATGQIDETMAVAKNLKPRDIQTCSVVLDFKKLEVVKAHMNGVTVPKDFNKIVEYYIQHYENIIKRLFQENGYEIEINTPEQKQPDPG